MDDSRSLLRAFRYCAITIFIMSSLSVSSICPLAKVRRRDPDVFTRRGDIPLVSTHYRIVLSFFRSPNCTAPLFSLRRSYLTPFAETTTATSGKRICSRKEMLPRLHGHASTRMLVHLPPSGVIAKVRTRITRFITVGEEKFSANTAIPLFAHT